MRQLGLHLFSSSSGAFAIAIVVGWLTGDFSGWSVPLAFALLLLGALSFRALIAIDERAIRRDRW